ncbi:WD40 repeat-like protein [Paxillus ammoniavirescens]|nr:WD40 repeat-like protein [Paxillus ammoniavirescens]
MLRFLRRVLPQRRDTARLDEDAPEVDLEALQQHAEEPKPSSQAPLKVLEGHTNTVEGLAFFPDGRRLVSGSWGKSLIIWDVIVGEAEKKLTGHTNWIRSVAMAPDGSVFASGSEDGTVRFWDGTNGNEIGEPIDTHSTGSAGVWGLAFSPDSRRVATTGNRTVQIWDVLTRASVTEPLRIPGGGDYTVAFSHDGSRIAVDAGHGSVGVWDSASREVVFDSLKGHTKDVFWTAFTPDGRQLVTASDDGTICRWDMETGARIGKPLTGHSEAIYNGVISRDGKTLATASHDRTVRFWDLKTGNQKLRFLQHKSYVLGVALSPDGSLLATAGTDDNVYIWNMKAIEAEFDEEAHHEAEASNHQNRAKIAQEQGSAGHRHEEDLPEVTSEEDRRSETSSTGRRLDMLTVGFSLSGAEASYYDREGDFWEGFNHAGPSDATENQEAKVEDPNEDKPNSHSQRRIFQQLKRLHRSLNPSKTPKDGPRNLSPQLEAPSAPENTGGASPHANPIVSHLPTDAEQIEAHRALEDGHGVDTLDPPSASTSVLRSHRPVSKFVGRRAWKSLLHPFHGDQPQITAVYSAYAPYRDAVAPDPSEPAKPPPKSETVPGNYATHSVLPPSPPQTPTQDSDHDTTPIEKPDEHKTGAFCGLCTRLFSRQSTPRPNAPGDANSGIEMAELRRRTEDGQISATATSTRPATSIANAAEGTQREQIDRRSAHDTAIEVERLRTEAQEKEAAAARAHELLMLQERLRIEAQEKEAAAARAHELLMLQERLRIEAQEKQAQADHELMVLDRQIELARIHAGCAAPGSVDPPQS